MKNILVASYLIHSVLCSCLWLQVYQIWKWRKMGIQMSFISLWGVAALNKEHFYMFAVCFYRPNRIFYSFVWTDFSKVSFVSRFVSCLAFQISSCHSWHSNSHLCSISFIWGTSTNYAPSPSPKISRHDELSAFDIIKCFVNMMELTNCFTLVT